MSPAKTRKKSSTASTGDAESLLPTKRGAKSLVVGVVFALALFCVWSKHKNLSVDERKRGMIGLSLGVLIAILHNVDKIPQSQLYHNFADNRCFCCVPNTFDVASNIPFLFVGLLGGDFIYTGPLSKAYNIEPPTFQAPYEREGWIIYFAAIALVAAGSGYYHWRPNSQRLVWDRLPMSIAFGSLYYIVLDETAGYQDVRLLLGLVSFSVFSVVYWAFTDDLRIYAFVQGYFLLTIPVYYILFSERVRYENYKQIFVSLGFYALAKMTEKFDKQVFALTGRTVSGHTLKHLLAGIATGWGILILQQRRQ